MYLLYTLVCSHDVSHYFPVHNTLLLYCIVVGDPPKVTDPMKDLIMVAPKQAVMECGIDPGTPVAEIRWFKDAKEVHDGVKYEMNYTDNVAELVVKDTEPSDTAKYRCEAANVIGRVETSANLTINSKCFRGIWFKNV